MSKDSSITTDRIIKITLCLISPGYVDRGCTLRIAYKLRLEFSNGIFPSTFREVDLANKGMNVCWRNCALSRYRGKLDRSIGFVRIVIAAVLCQPSTTQCCVHKRRIGRTIQQSREI